MFHIDHYASFVAAIVAFQLIPGPGTLTILNATARHGVRSGMDAVLGTLTGDFLFMFAAVLGLATVLAAHPAILGSLQWLGIAYLCWFGLKLMLANNHRQEAETARAQQRPACYRQALAVSLTNPKVIMFFMAFFPLFLTAGSHWPTLVIMMVHVSLISLLYQTALVLVGNAVAVRLARVEGIRVWARRVVGLALISFGIRLAVHRR
jgi:threonine/homoserine/homoserine lactone efflux protein